MRRSGGSSHFNSGTIHSGKSRLNWAECSIFVHYCTGNDEFNDESLIAKIVVRWTPKGEIRRFGSMGKRAGTGLPLGRLGRRRLCRVLSRTCLGLSVGCSKPAAKCCYPAINPICYHFGFEAHHRSLWAKQTRPPL